MKTAWGRAKEVCYWRRHWAGNASGIGVDYKSARFL